MALSTADNRWGVAALLVALLVVNLGLVAAAFELVQLDREGALSLDINNSWKERLYILDFVHHKIAERPLLGWGYDASRTIGQDTLSGFGNDRVIPFHPHNLWAQVWLETGLIGLLLSAGLVAMVLTRIAALRAGRSMIATAVTAATAYLLIANLSFGMWQNWWLAVDRHRRHRIADSRLYTMSSPFSPDHAPTVVELAQNVIRRHCGPARIGDADSAKKPHS